MLGQFLEYSVAARPLADSFEFFESLGFASIPVSDTLPDPYVVCFDGAHCHRAPRPRAAGPAADVRAPRAPPLRASASPARRRAHSRAPARQRVQLRRASTIPAAKRVELIEARTFPPGDWDGHNVAICGELFEVTLPAADLDASSRFWQAFGLTTAASGEAPHRWQRLVGHGVTLGLHETHCAPGLSFRCEDLHARLEYLRAKGLSARDRHRRSRIARKRRRRSTSPEGTHLYLVREEARSEAPLRRRLRLTSASASRSRACSGLERGKCVSRYCIWSASTRRPFR